MDTDPHRVRSIEPLLQALRIANVGVFRWHVGTEVVQWSDNMEAVHGLPPDWFDGKLSSFEQRLHADDVSVVWEAINASIDNGAPYEVVYRAAASGGEGEVWLKSVGGIVVDDEGRKFLTGVCSNVTDQVRSERELARRLKQHSGIEELGSFALGADDFQAVLERAVQTAGEVFDAPLTKVLELDAAGQHLVLRAGVGWAPGLVGSAEVGTEAQSQAGYTLSSMTPIVVGDLATETRFSGPPLLHDHGVKSGMSTVIAGHGSRPFGVLGVHSTEHRAFDEYDLDCLINIANIISNAWRQRQAHENQRLLVRETMHRAGNMLQIVSTLANQTFKEGLDLETARRAFSARLMAMSRANRLIAEGGWTPTQLSHLIDAVADAFRDRIQLDGPDVMLSPELSFDLGLVLHELTTNSAKYGAFSGDDGRITAQWRWTKTNDGHELDFEWIDAHTPAVSIDAGAGSGFGQKLKRALIEGKWGGKIEIDNQGGYRFACHVPIPD